MAGEARASGDGLAPGDSLPVTVRADFVARTVERVLADRAQIESEAQRVEEVALSAALLAEYRVPAPSASFVDRVLEALPVASAVLVAADAGAPAPRRPDPRPVVQRPVGQPPFVQRPIVQRPPLLQRPVVRWGAPIAAAAAAALVWLSSLQDAARQDGTPRVPGTAPVPVVDARQFAPSPWITAFGEDGRDERAGAPLRQPDPLLLFVNTRSSR
jgi:hypothetical protein